MQKILWSVIISNFFLFSQNYCLRFFGNGTGDIDRVKIPIDNPSTPADVGNSFTIEFQIRAKAADNPKGVSVASGPNDDWTLGHIIVDRDVFGNGDYGDYGISLAGGRIAFGVNNGTNSYTLKGNINISDDNWHHVAVTRNSSTGEIKIFIDGQIDQSYVSNVTGDISYRNGRTTYWVSDPYLVLGAEKHDYDNTQYPSFNGFLDELRISDIIRYSGSYIPQYQFTDDPRTVLLYHFDEGTGNKVYDAALTSGLPTHGTLNIGGNPQGPLWVLKNTSVNIEINNVTEKTDFQCYPTGVGNEVIFISSDEINEIYGFSIEGKKIPVQTEILTKTKRKIIFPENARGIFLLQVMFENNIKKIAKVLLFPG